MVRVLDRSYLIKELSRYEACKPALIKARNMNVDELLQLYIKNIDYSIESKLLTPEFLKSNASLGQLNHAGIYVDTSGSIINPGTLVLLGSGVVKTLHSDYNVSRIYTAQSTKLTVDACGNSHVTIDAYGDSEVIIHEHDKAHVFITLHDNATLTNY